MGLTAAWCHQIVLQHAEQDKCEEDEPAAITPWTSQRGKSLKERTGRGSGGKVEENKQTDKTVNETLVYHRMHQGKVECATGK